MTNELGINIIRRKMTTGAIRIDVISEVVENKVRHIGGIDVDRIKNKGHVCI